MTRIKAIYMPDIAYDSKEGNFNFVYNLEERVFIMEIDSEVRYSEDSIIDDDQWLLFETDLKEVNSRKYGYCKEIDVKEFIKIRDKMLEECEGDVDVFV